MLFFSFSSTLQAKEKGQGPIEKNNWILKLCSDKKLRKTVMIIEQIFHM
jgi:hypothetical protein